jgi:putative radical SAM enzyme (TIGR03279 family)
MPSFPVARRPQGGRVVAVEPGSPAARAGVVAGDYLFALDDHRLHDIIDYRFYSAEGFDTLTIERDGRRIVLPVDGEDDDLGVEFADALFTSIRRCANDCDFCFVDMNPQGLRPSLYIRDDDYRLSFLFGDFITLTNLNERDWARLAEQRLSPLYVSVHATDTAVRRQLLASPRANPIFEDLDRLASLGIQVHCQIVLCPGVNDGEVLERTVEELMARYPQVQTVAVVPVGLTRFSAKYDAAGLRRLTPDEARALVALGDRWRRRYTRLHGHNPVYLSDEVYVLAGMPMPAARAYAGYPQYENGIGMVRSWQDDLARWLRRWERRQQRSQGIAPRPTIERASIVSGELFGPVLQETARVLSAQTGVALRVVPVVNDFLGDSVTVAGLIAGQDVLRQLHGAPVGERLLVPTRALDQRGEVFLDGVGVADVARTVGAPVLAGREFADLLRALDLPA